MGVLGDSWCFCKGVSKSERTKAAIFSGKSPAMARISPVGNGAASATAFLIHKNLLLTTHANLPSVAAAESCEIRLHNGLTVTLLPHRFFITSSVLDLTIVGLDAVDGDSNTQQLQHLKTCSKPNLDLGSVVYLLGYSEKEGLTISEGRVIIATDNLIKLSTDGTMWSPGSAGFDAQGNLAFMVCDPMKLATSPTTKSSSTSSSSSSSWKKDFPMQFGIPLPIICDWLSQHWEGSLDELNKPKPQLMRLMSSGRKSEHSSASFTQRRVFKPIEVNEEGTSSLSPSNMILKTRNLPGPSCSTTTNTIIKEEALTKNLHVNHIQGIPTPEIYESPRLIAVPVRKKETGPMQLLDINFPPRVAIAADLPRSNEQHPLNSDENSAKHLFQQSPLRGGQTAERERVDPLEIREEVASTNSVNGAVSEVQSSSPPMEVPEMQNGYSSEGETMYSAETAESRNYPSPRKGKFQQVGRSQSCVSYNRWGSVQRNPVACRTMMENQKSFMNGRRLHSQGAASVYSPTVSSIMKKRNSSEQINRPRPSAAAHSSPRWMF